MSKKEELDLGLNLEEQPEKSRSGKIISGLATSLVLLLLLSEVSPFFQDKNGKHPKTNDKETQITDFIPPNIIQKLDETLGIKIEIPEPTADTVGPTKIDKTSKIDTELVQQNAQILDGIKKFTEFQKHLWENVKEHEIQKGENISELASGLGLHHNTIIALNEILGNKLKTRGSKVIVQVGDIIYLPKDVDQFLADYPEILGIFQILQRNTYLRQGDTKSFMEIGHMYKLFPDRVQSLGLGKVLDAFIILSRQGINPELPRIVDKKREHMTGCANMIRQMIAQSVNIQDLTETEKNYIQTQNLDAWILPKALIELGYTPKFQDLMDHFDSENLFKEYPIPEDEEGAYIAKVLNLGRYLDKHADELQGALWASLFRFSQHRGHMISWNKDEEIKHLNTHQAIIAGIGTTQFHAYEVPNIHRGKITYNEKPNQEQKRLYAYEMRAQFLPLEDKHKDNLGEFEDTKKRNIVDLIINFIQYRADFKGSLSSRAYKMITKSLTYYSELIHIEVNGQKIDFQEQFENYMDKTGEVMQVRPWDTIKITGPLVVDGEHQKHSPDEDKRDKMNARTRYYWEYLFAYYPTEILIPPKNCTFLKKDFDGPHNKLDIVYIFDLKEGQRLEDVLKPLIIKLEGLNPQDPDFEEKLNHLYLLHIRAYQIAGFLQDENRINDEALNVNRILPYFDVHSADIMALFNDYLQQRKQEIKDLNDKYSDIKNYVEFMIFPGDTYKDMFVAISDYTSKHRDKPKYPNLGKITTLNEFQQIMFLKEFLKKSFTKDKSMNIQNLIAGKLKPFESFAISLAELDNILAKIDQQTALESIELRPIDEFIINRLVPTKQNQAILKAILYVETYDGKQDGLSRKYLKQILEQMPYNLVNSIGDYQIRISSLKYGWGDEWLTKENITEALAWLHDEQIQNYISTLSEEHQEQRGKDMNRVRRIMKILSKDELSSRDFATILRNLELLIVIDDGSGKNIVGKIISTHLANKKVNLHIKRIYWLLVSAGENLLELWNKDETLEVLEKMVLLTYNQSENVVLYAMTENYILRVLKRAMGLDIKTQDVYSDTLKGQMLGKIVYGKYTFIKHLGNYIAQAEKQDLTDKQKKLLKKIKQAYQQMKASSGGINSIIYELLQNPEIKRFLEHKGLSSSLLLMNDELGDELQKSMFHYREKVDKGNGDEGASKEFAK